VVHGTAYLHFSRVHFREHPDHKGLATRDATRHTNGVRSVGRRLAAEQTLSIEHGANSRASQSGRAHLVLNGDGSANFTSLGHEVDRLDVHRVHPLGRSDFVALVAARTRFDGHNDAVHVGVGDAWAWPRRSVGVAWRCILLSVTVSQMHHPRNASLKSTACHGVGYECGSMVQCEPNLADQGHADAHSQ
jgi:hypothetical protein